MTERALLRIEVVYALPERCWATTVQLPAPATVGEALAMAVLPVPGLVVDPARLAVYGRTVELTSPLHDGDRIEILRPLQVDPKEARRQRAAAAKGR
jgi:putative ubiquitin-RnfH superfamily antitoxin RatB of RatAB toxin-antitoxin module